MRRNFFVGIVLLLGLAIQVYAAGKPAAVGKCTDIAVDWRLYALDPSGMEQRIYGDDVTRNAYGKMIPESVGAITFSGTIKKCTSGDAVLIVSAANPITYNFTDYYFFGGVTEFDSPPPGIKSCGGSPCVVVNVRNLVPAPSNDGPPSFGSDFVGPDNQRYNITTNKAVPSISWNESTDSGGKRHWIAYSIPAYPVTLRQYSKNGVLSLPIGQQFNMPFYFVIDEK